MPRNGVTIYDLLISCPGDVLDEIEIIRDVVETFNRNFGDINNIRIEVKHWSTDAYPESGGSAQELLNKQFIHNCDAAIAVLWTRFGTPTDKYQSGTEEEIEDMIKNGKQVFLYFSDKPANPSVINQEQYHKVKLFREKYADNKGLYWNYTDIGQFKQLLLNHLSLYFLKLLTKEEKENLELLLPNLIVRGVLDNNPSENLHIYHGNWIQSDFISGIKKEIEEKFQKVIELVLTDQKNEELDAQNEVEKYKNSIVNKRVSLALNSLIQEEPVNVSDIMRETISSYADSNKIKLTVDFFYIGNLKKTISGLMSNAFGNYGPSIEGTDDEKEKYKLIKNLYWRIKEYNEWSEFLLRLQCKHFTKCIVSNLGKTFDEDIEIRLKIKKGCICKKSELPIPGSSIIELFNENNLEAKLFKTKKSVFSDEYSNYPIKTNYSSLDYPMLALLNKQKTSEEKYMELKEEYEEMIDEIFCYEFFQTEDYDILVFKIPYLKQNTNINFPSVLVFNKNPKIIEYEIRSKYSPNIVYGEMELKEKQI